MKNINKIQKALLIGSLVSVAIIVVFLILAIFGASNKTTWKIVLCLLYVLAGCVFGVNALTFSNKNKFLAYFSLGLIVISVIGALILTWANAPTTAIQLEGTFAIATAFLVILIGITLKAAGHLKAMQLVFYILTIILDIILTIQVWGGGLFKYDWFAQVFVGFVIIDVGLLIALSILTKKTLADENKITITKEEYALLKQKAELYDQMNKESN